ncbi:hypothetical protein NOS3756_38000 [Nostoc sp. NIES-3756]|uniref:hypothetical protein n=1 Tax=Nostoc sp. NIES-3756 TaxID=1751286 RepID=UPI000720256B|nr:hypothetical protein [Nostoc sp. NIES-3756]BAT54825.1 hypothetical protein NOS3756_38000 [Nostoc sp. NIES-3756]BAY37406.1 hypothetical protein NIES2111_17430 [Nostoc sp. NIES-2111]
MGGESTAVGGECSHMCGSAAEWTAVACFSVGVPGGVSRLVRVGVASRSEASRREQTGVSRGGRGGKTAPFPFLGSALSWQMTKRRQTPH